MSGVSIDIDRNSRAGLVFGVLIFALAGFSPVFPALAGEGPESTFLEEANRAVLRNPKDPDVYLDRASEYYMKGEIQKALADIDRAIVLAPARAGAYAYRATCKALLSRPNEAIADFEKCLSLLKEGKADGKSVKAFGDDRIITVDEINKSIGDCYRDLKMPAQALAFYALVKVRDDPYFYYCRGCSYLEIKENKKALLDFERIYASKNYGDSARSKSIDAWTALGDDKRAMELCNYLVEKRPNWRETFVKRAALFDKLGDSRAADRDRESFRKIVEQYEKSKGSNLR